jgi:hypothetical protein
MRRAIPLLLAVPLAFMAPACSASSPAPASRASTAGPLSPGDGFSAGASAPPVSASPRPSGPGGCTIPPPPAPPAGLTLSACYRLTGEVSGSGGFVDEGQGTSGLGCAAWALRGDEPPDSPGAVLFLPDPGDAQATLDGQPLSFYLEIASYTGPGAYATSGGVAESVTWGGESWSTNADPGAAFSARVSSDGSGTATASGLRNDASTGGTETVTETWTCAVASGG